MIEKKMMIVLEKGRNLLKGDIFKCTSFIWFGQHSLARGYDLVVMILASQASHTGSKPVTRIQTFFSTNSTFN